MEDKWKKENLEPIVKSSNSIKECLEKLGIEFYTARYSYIKGLIKKYKIDISHFKSSSELRSEALKISKRKNPKYDIKEIFVENPLHNLSNNSLKLKLNELGWEIDICSICKSNNNWRGKKMSMVLDHINGVRNDHRLKNLRILCPNCNSTLDTHCGKNR